MAKSMDKDQLEQIAMLIKQGYTSREIQQELGIPEYRIQRARQSLSVSEAYRRKHLSSVSVRTGFWDEWDAVRGGILQAADTSARHMPARFWDEWDAARGTLLKAKRKEAAG